MSVQAWFSNTDPISSSTRLGYLLSAEYNLFAAETGVELKKCEIKNVCVYLHTNTYICTCVCTYADIHTYIHIAFVYVSAHTHTHTEFYNYAGIAK